MAVSDKKTRVAISMTNEMLEKLEQEAAKRGVSKSALVCMVLSEWMAQKAL